MNHWADLISSETLQTVIVLQMILNYICDQPEETIIITSGPQTTARLPMWTGPLNNTRDAFRFIIVFTWPAAVEIAVRRGENVKWCSLQ